MARIGSQSSDIERGVSFSGRLKSIHKNWLLREIRIAQVNGVDVCGEIHS